MKKLRIYKQNPLITCRVPVEQVFYVVNGVVYDTLKDAAIANNVSTSSLSMYLSGKRNSDNIRIHCDTKVIYREEKHRLSFALFNKYEIVNK